MARVELVDFTGAGRPDQHWHAAHMLLMTKDTRLELTGGDPSALSAEAVGQALKIMSETIPSSWEFVSLTFKVSGVSRACAQQMTRTRTGSYAMQSQRVVDASDVGVVNPFQDNALRLVFEEAATWARYYYAQLIEKGAAKQDARGILPVNSESVMMCCYNLRAFSDLVKSRESLRTQGEHRDIIIAMKEEVLRVWPWVEQFFVPREQLAIEVLERVVGELGLTVGSGPAWQIAKAIDLLRKV